MRQFILILVVVVFFCVNANSQYYQAFQVGGYSNVQLDLNLDSITAKLDSISPFRFSIETTKNGIKLTNTKGCAFKELTFSLFEGDTQAIDQFGMRELNKKGKIIKTKKVKDDNLASFVLTITKVKEGEFVLKGIEGTDWLRLGVSCRDICYPIINQSGVRFIEPECF